jgi:hypothetical protein
MVFDGGAYASTSLGRVDQRRHHTQGPYRCPNATVDGQRFAPTTCRAERCVASGSYRLASLTKVRWTLAAVWA